MKFTSRSLTTAWAVETLAISSTKATSPGNVQVATGSMTPVGIPSEGYVNTLKGYQGASFNFIGEYGPVTFRAGYSRNKTNI